MVFIIYIYLYCSVVSHSPSFSLTNINKASSIVCISCNLLVIIFLVLAILSRKCETTMENCRFGHLSILKFVEKLFCNKLNVFSSDFQLFFLLISLFKIRKQYFTELYTLYIMPYAICLQVVFISETFIIQVWQTKSA